MDGGVNLQQGQGWKWAPTTRCYHSAGFDNMDLSSSVSSNFSNPVISPWSSWVIWSLTLRVNPFPSPLCPFKWKRTTNAKKCNEMKNCYLFVKLHWKESLQTRKKSLLKRADGCRLSVHSYVLHIYVECLSMQVKSC